MENTNKFSIKGEELKLIQFRWVENDDNFDIIINPDKGDLEIWRNRIVVADGEVEEPNQEIYLSFNISNICFDEFQ